MDVDLNYIFQLIEPLRNCVRPVHKKHFLDYPKMLETNVREGVTKKVSFLHEVLGTTYFTRQNTRDQVAFARFGP